MAIISRLRKKLEGNVALNKISGEWDNDKLALLIADLQGTDFDVSLTGFEPAHVPRTAQRCAVVQAKLQKNRTYGIYVY